MYVIDFLQLRRSISKDQFAARHPDAVLILQSPDAAAANADDAKDLLDRTRGVETLSMDEDSDESTIAAVQAPRLARPGGGSNRPDTLSTLSSMKTDTLLRRAAEGLLVLPVKKTGVNLYQDKITVGRASNNDVIIQSPSVSKFHAYFRRNEDGTYTLTDAGSKNGTFINWQPLAARKPALLKDGLELIFGEVSCRYHDAGGFFDFLGRFLSGGR